MTEDFIALEDFVPALSPRFMAPKHLRPLTDLFQRIARGEEVKAVVDVPPRNGKTETLIHAIPWLLVQDPEIQIAYASYAQRISEKKSRRARELAKRAGVPLSVDSMSRADWRTTSGEGGLWATSVGGSITGEGFNLIILDDLIRGRADAESGAVRERAHDWLLSDVLTRLEPGGSIVLSMARWHPEDPAGHALALGWEHVNLPALDAEDRPLWPERWPRETLLELRETLGGPSGYEWQSLYCGSPRGRGARVFGDVMFYDEFPSMMSVAIGLDFAYSTKASADCSVAVVLGLAAGRWYVLDVVRVREEPKDFRARVRALVERFPRAQLSAYVSGTESGIIAFFRDGGLHVQTAPASADKFTRAVRTAAQWNTGKILLPRSAPWLNDFVSELAGFTGIKDRHDDQVDALVAACDTSGGAIAQREARRRKIERTLQDLADLERGIEVLGPGPDGSRMIRKDGVMFAEFPRERAPETRRLLGYVQRTLLGIGMHRVAIYEGMKVHPHETLEPV